MFAHRRLNLYIPQIRGFYIQQIHHANIEKYIAYIGSKMSREVLLLTPTSSIKGNNITKLQYNQTRF